MIRFWRKLRGRSRRQPWPAAEQALGLPSARGEVDWPTSGERVPPRATWLPSLIDQRLRFGRLSRSSPAGTRPSFALGIGTDFADFRRYVPGDDLRFLDWNAYGRLDALYLKRFEAFDELTLDVIIDRTLSMSLGGRGEGTVGHKLTFARSPAAALGYVSLNGLDSVRLLPLPWSRRPTMGRRWQGRGALEPWLTSVDNVAPAPISRHDRSLRDFYVGRPREHFVVVISDFHEIDAWRPFFSFLRRRVAAVLALHLVAPEELTPTRPSELGEEAELRDVELPGSPSLTGRLRLEGDLVTRYRRQLASYLDQVRESCSAQGAGYVRIRTDEPLKGALWSQLRGAGLLT